MSLCVSVRILKCDTLGHQDIGTRGHPETGTLKHETRDTRTLGHWDRGILGHQDTEILGHQDTGTMDGVRVTTYQNHVVIFIYTCKKLALRAKFLQGSLRSPDCSLGSQCGQQEFYSTDSSVANHVLLIHETNFTF